MYIPPSHLLNNSLDMNNFFSVSSQRRREKLPIQKSYGRRHKLVDRYQIAMDIFP
jgi:hypothetical protein